MGLGNFFSRLDLSEEEIALAKAGSNENAFELSRVRNPETLEKRSR
jgi:hypothetical protein